LGHKRLARFVTEVAIAGQGFLRLDVPGEAGAEATQYLHPNTIYALTPTTQALARRVAAQDRPAPGQVPDYPGEPDPWDAEQEPDDDVDDEEPKR
jgi:hypothetical protein